MFFWIVGSSVCSPLLSFFSLLGWLFYLSFTILPFSFYFPIESFFFFFLVLIYYLENFLYIFCIYSNWLVLLFYFGINWIFILFSNYLCYSRHMFFVDLFYFKFENIQLHSRNCNKIRYLFIFIRNNVTL